MCFCDVCTHKRQVAGNVFLMMRFWSDGIVALILECIGRNEYIVINGNLGFWQRIVKGQLSIYHWLVSCMYVVIYLRRNINITFFGCLS